METEVAVPSDGLTLAGVLHVPDTHQPDERLPAFIVLHGFMGSKDGSHAEITARMMCDWGYAALRVDFRGCGQSAGEPGYVRCPDQVADTSHCLSWLAQRPEIDATGIGLIGHSFGAAIALYTGGIDERVAAVISTCGWGHGERKFRGQHPGEKAWSKFTSILEGGRHQLEQTGEPMWVSRWDLVPVPEFQRKNLPKDAIDRVRVDTAQSMFDFRAEEVVGKIAPRPLLLLHTANDQVTPTEQSLRLFEKAGDPTELYVVNGESHFPLAGDGEPARTLIKNWLDRYFPTRDSAHKKEQLE